MPRISLTDFVDIVSRVGMQKVTKISEIKNRDDYSPLNDYWKIVRDHIIDNHSSGGNRTTLKTAEQLTQNHSKLINYAAVLNGYRTFWGRKNLVWFQPPSLVWSYNDLDISLNPELGLVNGDEWYAIKLYFKAEKLSKAKADLILFLMHQVLPQIVNGHPIIYTILDVRNAKNIIPNGFNAHTIAALQGEAQYVLTVWPKV